MTEYVESYAHKMRWELSKVESSYHGRVHIPNVGMNLKPRVPCPLIGEITLLPRAKTVSRQEP